MSGQISGGAVAGRKGIQGAAPSGAGTVSNWRFDRVLAAMIAKGHGLEALQCCLGVTVAFILERVVACGMATPPDHPMRRSNHPRAWKTSDLSLFIECWIANWDGGSMADTFGRSRGGIYALSRRLGLPSRRRGDIRRPTIRAVGEMGEARQAAAAPRAGSSLAGGSQALPPIVSHSPVAQPPILTSRRRAQVICTLSPVEAPTAAVSGRRTSGLQQADTQAEMAPLPTPEAGMRRVRTLTGFDGLPLAVEVRASRGQVAWTPRLELYLASTRWAGQHPRAVARDLGIPFSAVVSRLHLMNVPPRPREELTDTYDPDLARRRLHEAGMEVRQCHKHAGRLFFGNRWTYVAPLTKRSSGYQREVSNLDH